MTRLHAICSLIGIAVLLSSWTTLGFGGAFEYEAAVYSGGPAFTGEQRIRLFPSAGSSVKNIPLPFPLGLFVVDPDGKALYAQAGIESPVARPKAGIFIVELHPVRASLIRGSTVFRSSYSLAISAHRDLMLVSGSYWNGTSPACGVFEFVLKDASVRQILSTNCNSDAAWTDLSLSPDGLEAVATDRGRLGLIDLAKKSVTSIAQGFRRAAWSPDGKWIAAQEASAPEDTVLFETHMFTRARTLGNSGVLWSPDSRYLLAWKSQLLCGPYHFTLEKVDVRTGDRQTIQSSKCKVIESSGAWMSAEISP